MDVTEFGWFAVVIGSAIVLWRRQIDNWIDSMNSTVVPTWWRSSPGKYRGSLQTGIFGILLGIGFISSTNDPQRILTTLFRIGAWGMVVAGGIAFATATAALLFRRNRIDMRLRILSSITFGLGSETKLVQRFLVAGLSVAFGGLLLRI